MWLLPRLGNRNQQEMKLAKGVQGMGQGTEFSLAFELHLWVLGRILDGWPINKDYLFFQLILSLPCLFKVGGWNAISSKKLFVMFPFLLLSLYILEYLQIPVPCMSPVSTEQVPCQPPLPDLARPNMVPYTLQEVSGVSCDQGVSICHVVRLHSRFIQDHYCLVIFSL